MRAADLRQPVNRSPSSAKGRGASMGRVPHLPDASLRLEEELHFYTGDFNQIVIGKLFSLSAQRHTIDGRKHCAFDMGNEKSSWAPGNDCDLNTGLADGREVFDEVQCAACGSAGQYLNG